MSDLTAMVLMVIVTLVALSVIWGTYVRRRLLSRRGSTLLGEVRTPLTPAKSP